MSTPNYTHWRHFVLTQKKKNVVSYFILTWSHDQISFPNTSCKVVKFVAKRPIKGYLEIDVLSAALPFITKCVDVSFGMIWLYSPRNWNAAEYLLVVLDSCLINSV